MTTSSGKIPRILPMLDSSNTGFWTAGDSGRLHISRCQACGWWNHPPSPACRACYSRDLAYEAASGTGTVATYTINRHGWLDPQDNEPYVIAIVELPEQVGLRLTTNIVNCDVDEVYIGMPVRVQMLKVEDVVLPLFEPVPRNL